MNANIIETIFGKSIHTLDLNDIINYFKKEQRETDLVEFKSYKDFATSGTTKNNRDKEKMNDIMRTLCAFLNSEGGILIWGAPEGISVNDGQERIFQGDLTPVSVLLEADQFINKVVSQITPMPAKILFHSIPMNENSFCYIFEVKKSDYSPHQFKGTYFMRLDGSTRPAPHHYVEALVKKISYPRLEGYLTFGTIRDYSILATIPMQLTIHNMSKFIHEKKVQYRILASGVDILDPYKNFQLIQFTYGADIDKQAKDILHYNMPYYDNFLLLTKRLMPRSQNIYIDIFLSVWGELSPVVTSRYKIEVSGNAQSVRTQYIMLEKSENVYLHESSGDVESNEQERMEKSRKLLLDQFQSKIHELAIHEQLRKMT